MSEDLPGSLPLRWATISIADLSELVTDGDHNPPKRATSGVPHLTAKNVKRGALTLDGCTYLSREGFAQTRKRYDSRPGDVVVTCVGTIGETAVVPSGLEFSADRNLAVIRPKADVVRSRFLQLLLTEPRVAHQLRNASGSTAQPHLYLGDLRSLRVPVPSLDEQDRVLLTLDEYLSRLDAGVEALQRLQAHLRRYRAAVLVEATRNWTVTPLRELVSEPFCNGKSVKGSDDPPGIPALRLNAMGDSGFDYSSIRYIPLEWSDVEDIAVAEGDFFVSRGNGSLRLVGRGTLAQAPPQPIIFPDTMIRVRLQADLRETGWVHAIWSSQVIREQIESMAKTTAGIWKISQGDLGSILVPMPPKSKQLELVANLSAGMSHMAQQDLVARRTLVRAARLRSAVLRAAFSGALPSLQAPERES